MNYGKDFTLVINCISQDSTIFMNCLSSFYDLDDQPARVIATFSPFHRDYAQLFDLEEIRFLDVIKTDTHIPLNQIRNFTLRMVTTPYVVFVFDDTSVRAENLFQLIHQKHNDGYWEVRLSERQVASSFVTKHLGYEMAGFDPFYTGSGFEDIDFRLQANLYPGYDKIFQFDPYLIRHLRKEPQLDIELARMNFKRLVSKWMLQKEVDENITDPRTLLYSNIWQQIEDKYIAKLNALNGNLS
jgi:hypothetical protein